VFVLERPAHEGEMHRPLVADTVRPDHVWAACKGAGTKLSARLCLSDLGQLNDSQSLSSLSGSIFCFPNILDF